MLFEFLFWISLALIFWTYLGYPIFLGLLRGRQRSRAEIEDYAPMVSLIITAYNEEARIAEKIENALHIDYPRDKFQIIVASDGSADRTVEIAESYKPYGIEVLAMPERRGKHNTQGKAIREAKGEIIVLSDATTFLERDAVKKIVRNFADPGIGCVSGLDNIISVGEGESGESAYVKYEMKIRELESQANSMIGASGSFFAVRKIICDRWIGDISSDFYLPLYAYTRGYETVLEKEAVGNYGVTSGSGSEFRRKVRTIVHGIDVISRIKTVLNPFKYGLFSVQVISHKIIRWLVPFFLIFLFISNLALIGRGTVYAVLFIIQIYCYAAAILAFRYKNLQQQLIFKIPFFFLLANLSILIAWYEFARGERYIWWKATKR